MMYEIEPQLLVHNVKTACEYFVEKLGFLSDGYSYVGHTRVYTQVVRDRVAIGLLHRAAYLSAYKSRLQIPPDYGHLMIAMDTLDEYYNELVKRNATIIRAPQKDPDTPIRNMLVAGPDDYILCFNEWIRERDKEKLGK